jgi:hypothetical protein
MNIFKIIIFSLSIFFSFSTLLYGVDVNTLNEFQTAINNGNKSIIITGEIGGTINLNQNDLNISCNGAGIFKNINLQIQANNTKITNCYFEMGSATPIYLNTENVFNLTIENSTFNGKYGKLSLITINKNIENLNLNNISLFDFSKTHYAIELLTKSISNVNIDFSNLTNVGNPIISKGNINFSQNSQILLKDFIKVENRISNLHKLKFISNLETITLNKIKFSKYKENSLNDKVIIYLPKKTFAEEFNLNDTNNFDLEFVGNNTIIDNFVNVYGNYSNLKFSNITFLGSFDIENTTKISSLEFNNINFTTKKNIVINQGTAEGGNYVSVLRVRNTNKLNITNSIFNSLNKESSILIKNLNNLYVSNSNFSNSNLAFDILNSPNLNGKINFNNFLSVKNYLNYDNEITPKFFNFTNNYFENLLGPKHNIDNLNGKGDLSNYTYFLPFCQNLNCSKKIENILTGQNIIVNKNNTIVSINENTPTPITINISENVNSNVFLNLENFSNSPVPQIYVNKTLSDNRSLFVNIPSTSFYFSGERIFTLFNVFENSNSKLKDYGQSLGIEFGTTSSSLTNPIKLTYILPSTSKTHFDVFQTLEDVSKFKLKKTNGNQLSTFNFNNSIFKINLTDMKNLYFYKSYTAPKISSKSKSSKSNKFDTNLEDYEESIVYPYLKKNYNIEKSDLKSAYNKKSTKFKIELKDLTKNEKENLQINKLKNYEKSDAKFIIGEKVLYKFQKKKEEIQYI